MKLLPLGREERQREEWEDVSKRGEWERERERERERNTAKDRRMKKGNNRWEKGNKQTYKARCGDMSPPAQGLINRQ